MIPKRYKPYRCPYTAPAGPLKRTWAQISRRIRNGMLPRTRMSAGLYRRVASAGNCVWFVAAAPSQALNPKPECWGFQAAPRAPCSRPGVLPKGCLCPPVWSRAKPNIHSSSYEGIGARALAGNIRTRYPKDPVHQSRTSLRLRPSSQQTV